jgi:glycosyltransferase involved in cell wall biosynthesis
MAASGPRARADDEHSGGLVVCELSQAAEPGAGIARLVNHTAGEMPGFDIAVSFGGEADVEGWASVLQTAAQSESAAATVSALTMAAAGAVDAHRRAALEAAMPGVGQALIVETGVLAAQAPAPRVRLVSGPFVYIVRAALDLLGGLDESLATSAAAIADFGLRASARGLTNLVATRLLATPGPALLLDDRDRATLERRFPKVFPTLEEPPTEALERSLGLAKAATERKLDVTVDARALGTAAGGTQTYLLELLRALAASGEVQVRALLADDGPAELAELPNTERITYDAAIRGAPVSDIVHRPQQVFTVHDLNLLELVGRRLVITQLDLIAYHSPGYFPDLDSWRGHVRATRIAMGAADRVLFLSEHARADAEREDLIDRARTAVVPLGMRPDRSPEGSPPAALQHRDEPFLLCLGADYAHKNRPYALALTGALRARGWRGLLVLAGPHVDNGSSAAAEKELVEGDADLEGAVVDLGTVPEAQRHWLMSHARAIVYPTVLEGFGLIPLEAAVAGVPCLFAAQSSLAEILPDHLATLDGWDLGRSVLAAWPLLTDDQQRGAHVKALREVMLTYTWDRCVRLTIEGYEAALASRARLSAHAAWEARTRELEIARLGGAVHELHDAMQRLRDSVGEDGLALVGPDGLLDDGDRRALLALAVRPPLKRPVFAALRGGYRVLHRKRG